jgi:hypothetical protein
MRSMMQEDWKEKVHKPDKEEGEDDVPKTVVHERPGIAYDVWDEEPDPQDRYDGWFPEL